MFSDTELDELASSIRERGIIQPIVVRPVRGAADSFEIIAGERRWRAAQRAGLHDVPIVVLEASDSEALELAIIENVQRADLNPLEEAAGYQALADEFKYSQDDIAKIVGKSRSHVANTLRLLKLPETVKAYINAGKLTAGHARALIGPARSGGDGARDRRARPQCAPGRGAGAAARTMPPARRKSRGSAPQRTPTRSRSRSGCRMRSVSLVTIDHRGEGGVVRIKYRGLDQLDDVIRRLEKD